MIRLFISYRHADTEQIAGRIHDRLVQRFPSADIFFDIDSIPHGVDFRRRLDEAVRRSHVFLALVGPAWMEPDGRGVPRILSADDVVRREIASAFAAEVAVIPVVIGRAVMPREADLPDQLAGFAGLNAAQVDPGRDFDPHMERLLDSIGQHLWAPLREERLNDRLVALAQRQRSAASATQDAHDGLSAENRDFFSTMDQIARLDERAGVLLEELIELDRERVAGTVAREHLDRYSKRVFDELERNNADKAPLQEKQRTLSAFDRDAIRRLIGKPD